MRLVVVPLPMPLVRVRAELGKLPAWTILPRKNPVAAAIPMMSIY
jgi:hypothetical protein